LAGQGGTAKLAHHGPRVVLAVQLGVGERLNREAAMVFICQRLRLQPCVNFFLLLYYTFDYVEAHCFVAHERLEGQ